MSWIKMRAALLDHPKVVAMADFLNATWEKRRSREASLFPHPVAAPYDEMWVIGALFSVWVWVDQHSEDGTHVRVTSAFLDRRTACPDFADAMRAVGWLSGRDQDLTFPAFEEHNGETAKRRAAETKRKQEQRGREREEETGGGTNVRERVGLEKSPSREEKSSKATDSSTPRTPALLSPPLRLGDSGAGAGKGIEDSRFARPVEQIAQHPIGKRLTGFVGISVMMEEAKRNGAGWLKILTEEADDLLELLEQGERLARTSNELPAGITRAKWLTKRLAERRAA